MWRLRNNPIIGKERFAIRNDKVVLATIQMVNTHRGVVTSYKMRTDEIAEGEFSEFMVDKKYTGTDKDELLKKLFKLKLKGIL